MKQQIEKLMNDFNKELSQVAGISELRDIEVKYLGKKSEIYTLLRGIGSIKEPSDKKEMGRLINIAKTEMANAISDKREKLSNEEIQKKTEASFDMTMPVSLKNKGSMHPVAIVQRDLERIFTGMGFTIVSGPEMETEYYNFEALNVPKHHPARDMQDTFWLENSMLLRTQTSTCQVRAMEKYKAPLRVIAPGKCFRYEAIDASHENTFYQMEGLLIDRNITIGNLIATMKTLLSAIFERDVKVRLRPGYFPFVEPGFELDINCLICGGKGCKTCKHTGWLELLPCGMVHPNVLRMSGVDPDEFNGFAFGLGLTRLAMMKYNIHDIRLFNSADLRFLKQFRGSL